MLQPFLRVGDLLQHLGTSVEAICTCDLLLLFEGWRFWRRSQTLKKQTFFGTPCLFQGLRDLALPDLHVHSTLLPLGGFQHSDLQVGAPCLKFQLDLCREIRRATAIRTSLSRSQKREIGWNFFLFTFRRQNILVTHVGDDVALRFAFFLRLQKRQKIKKSI